jgi:RNA polymerase sigma factor (sigma-70 family)
MQDTTEHKSKLSAFFARENARLVNYVRSYFSDRANMDAEDVVQDVAYNMFARADFSVPVENLASYVFRSLRNKVIDLQRKRELKTVSIDSEDDENNPFYDLPYPEEDTPPLSSNPEYQMMMMNLIEELKPEQQAVIIETEFEGRTFEELSKEWGIPIGTLLARKHRAMAKLHQLMEPEINKVNN